MVYTNTQTDRHKDSHVHEYSIVAVEKTTTIIRRLAYFCEDTFREVPESITIDELEDLPIVGKTPLERYLNL